MTIENYNLIKSISGVIRFLGVENPEPLPDDEKAYITLLNHGGKAVGASKVKVLKSGAKKVISGILKKYEDKIVFINLRQRRAGIELELCGKKHFIILPVAELENNA